MTLYEYISGGHGTITQIGQATNTSDDGVTKWMYGARAPDLETAFRIQTATRGMVTVGECRKPVVKAVVKAAKAAKRAALSDPSSQPQAEAQAA